MDYRLKSSFSFFLFFFFEGYSAFGEHFIKSGIFPRKMGKELNRAFEKRQLGDYEYTFVIAQDEADKMLHTYNSTGKQTARE